MSQMHMGIEKIKKKMAAHNVAWDLTKSRNIIFPGGVFRKIRW